MVEVAEELVEAVHRRQVGVVVAQVVLAELAGAVAGLPEHLGQARRGGLQAELVARLADRGHARTNRILAGDERRASGGAGGLPVVIGEADALHADAVDARRGVAHGAHAVGADILPTDVVAPDHQDVGLVRLGLRQRRGEQGTGEACDGQPLDALDHERSPCCVEMAWRLGGARLWCGR
ncbi:hypothetical protein D3C85_1198780 [compost metagenome]